MIKYRYQSLFHPSGLKCWEKFTFYSFIVNEIDIFITSIKLRKYKIGTKF